MGAFRRASLLKLILWAFHPGGTPGTPPGSPSNNRFGKTVGFPPRGAPGDPRWVPQGDPWGPQDHPGGPPSGAPWGAPAGTPQGTPQEIPQGHSTGAPPGAPPGGSSRGLAGLAVLPSCPVGPIFGSAWFAVWSGCQSGSPGCSEWPVWGARSIPDPTAASAGERQPGLQMPDGGEELGALASLKA